MLFYLVGGLLGVGVAGQCATGTPLVGRLGAPLFCGVGELSVPCPAGSVCVLPAGACCPSPVIATQPVVQTATVPSQESRCQFGSPWTNAMGIELNCGPGPNHADCPAGSQCITGPNNAFFACCAISASSAPPIPTIPVTPPIQSQSSQLQSSQSQSSQSQSSQSQSQSDQLTTQVSSEQREHLAELEKESNSTDDSDSNSSLTVRFLNIQIIEEDVIVMWAPPEGEEPASYLAEFSYDGQEWEKLDLEEPDATFIEFPLEERRSFQVRVTPEGGSPALQSWQFRQGKGKLGKMGKMGKMGKN